MAVVVDVLSFTTTVSIAIDEDVMVFARPLGDPDVAAFARRNDAVLAVSRAEATHGQVSLSPKSLRCGSLPSRIVLPSPNGSTIAHHISGELPTLVAASLRNAKAVASWIASHHPAATVAVIAAGETWPDGHLRPAAEDLWGAGAVIDHLVSEGLGLLSVEAELARSAYLAVRGDERHQLEGCASGRELIDTGYHDDLLIAAEIDSSSAVPLFTDGAFRPPSTRV